METFVNCMLLSAMNTMLLNSGKWVFEWVGEWGDVERPFVFICQCYTYPEVDDCAKKTGNYNKCFCGLGTGLTGCIGFCLRDYDTRPQL